MFTAIIVSPDAALAEGIGRLANASGQVIVQKTLEHYPSSYELTRAMNSGDPELVFLDLSDWERAATLAARVRNEFSSVAVIGFAGGWGQGSEAMYTKAGVTVLLASPVTLEVLRDGIARAVRAVRGAVLHNLWAFLPAKAGAGCSVTVLNVASRLAEELGKRTLLIEGDLHSGVVETRLGLRAAVHLQDALNNPGALNRTEWDRLVVRRQFDILPAAAPKKGDMPDWSNYHHLIEYACSAYEAVLVDLPEVVNEATSEVVLRAQSNYVVTTATRVSLELARRRLAGLTAMGVDRLRAALVVNHWEGAGEPPTEIDGLPEHRIAAVLPEDEAARDVPAPAGSDYGYACLSLAAAFSGAPMPEVPRRKARFRIAGILGR